MRMMDDEDDDRPLLDQTQQTLKYISVPCQNISNCQPGPEPHRPLLDQLGNPWYNNMKLDLTGLPTDVELKYW